MVAASSILTYLQKQMYQKIKPNMLVFYCLVACYALISIVSECKSYLPYENTVDEATLSHVSSNASLPTKERIIRIVLPPPYIDEYCSIKIHVYI